MDEHQQAARLARELIDRALNWQRPEPLLDGDLWNGDAERFTPDNTTINSEGFRECHLCRMARQRRKYQWIVRRMSLVNLDPLFTGDDGVFADSYAERKVTNHHGAAIQFLESHQDSPQVQREASES